MQLFDFDIEKKYAYLILVVIFTFYTGFTALTELWTEECTGIQNCHDFDRRMAKLAVWNLDWFKDDLRHVGHLGLLTLSYQLFGNYKVLVLASSVLLLVVSYLYTKALSGKRIAGIIAVIVVLQSTVFHQYDTSVTYPSFWALLFAMSIYLCSTKQSYLSPLSFLLSIPAKALTALFFPALLSYLWIQGKKKLLIAYGVIGVVGLFVIIFLSPDRRSGGLLLIDDIHVQKFVIGFVSWMWKGFADDQITLLLLVIFGFLLHYNRKVIPNATSVMVLTVGMILTSPILTGMTTYDVWPYRMLPVVVMVGVIVGLVVSNIDKINFKMFKLR